MSLIPMEFRQTNLSIFETHPTNTFHLPPSAQSITLFQTHPLTNGVSSRNCFNIGNFPKKFKVHCSPHDEFDDI